MSTKTTEALSELAIIDSSAELLRALTAGAKAEECSLGLNMTKGQTNLVIPELRVCAILLGPRSGDAPVTFPRPDAVAKAIVEAIEQNLDAIFADARNNLLQHTLSERLELLHGLELEMGMVERAIKPEKML